MNIPAGFMPKSEDNMLFGDFQRPLTEQSTVNWILVYYCVTLAPYLTVDLSYSWFKLHLNITCCVTFTESSAEVVQTHSNYLFTFIFRSGRAIFTFRGSVVIPQYFSWSPHDTQCSNTIIEINCTHTLCVRCTHTDCVRINHIRIVILFCTSVFKLTCSCLMAPLETTWSLEGMSVFL